MIDQEELLEKYAGTEKDFTGQSFQDSHWVNKIVIGGIYQRADFSGAYFELSGFDQCDLSFANFRRARMYESGFGADCYMEGVDFSNAIFNQCNFRGVNLSKVIFRNATLSEINFKNANLSYADLREAKEFEIGRCKNAIFHKTIMPDGSIRTDASSN